MKYPWSESARLFGEYPRAVEQPRSIGSVFEKGARWMMHWKERLDGKGEGTPLPAVDFQYYGGMKYAICLTVASFVLLAPAPVWLRTVGFVLVFYAVEIQFLFLFPLLLDGIGNPWITSIRATYRLGYVRALFRVIPIGAYMVCGLFRWRDPYRNWHIGALAVLIWYQHELRDWVRGKI